MSQQPPPSSDGIDDISIDKAYSLALDHFKADNLIAADRLCTTIIKTHPNSIAAINLLGLIAQKINRHDQAANIFKRALNIDGNNAVLHYNLGISFYQLGNRVESVKALQKSLAINPKYIEAYSSIGNTLTELGKLDSAISNLQKAITLKADYADAHYNIAIAYKKQAKIDLAITHFTKATQITPYFKAHFNLGNTFRDMGQLENAIASYQRAIDIEPGFIGSHNNLLLTSQYLQNQTLENLYLIHSKWANEHFNSSNIPLFTSDIDRDENRKLKIGLISPDFRLHPVGYFMAGFFKHYQASMFEIVCYSDSKKDKMTDMLESYVDSWVFSKNFTDDLLAQRIVDDRIDILFDLAGHTENNRLQLFANKLAPIQISWAGYVGTTGLSAMDYLIGDKYYTPHGDDRYYSEKIIRLPDSWVCYTPPDYIPEVEQKPSTDQRQIILGNFGNPTKINSMMLEVWAQILLKIPNSNLLLIYKNMDSQTNIQRIRGYFNKAGIANNRITIEGHTPHKKLLQRYNEVDLALDTLPYSGGLTTFEALLMGVPVVTTYGATFAGRHASSILHNAGLAQLVTDSLDEYINVVENIINNPQQLKNLKNGLRQRLLNSAMCDYNKFSTDLGQQLRDAWIKWCKGEKQRKTLHPG
ncbi:MAG: tetratricopeptide repeat protein [Magnetococcales bacterium]|nr:tetratricopeptide repeat protein [Magnetococcales bacterium]